MLDNCKTAQERWGGVSKIIDRWLHERSELLTQYTELEKTAVLDGRIPEDSQRVLKFCQILVDYVSTGHFEVYGQLAKEGDDFKDQEGLEVAGELYRVIDETTQKILDFNDKYQVPDDLKSAVSDLADLGEQLRSRFEAEDCMINVLHTSHASQATLS